MPLRIARFAALLAAVAVVAAAGATAAQKLTGEDIRNGSLTGLDLKKRSVGPTVFTDDAQSSLRGPRGKIGQRGPSDVFVHRRGEAAVRRSDSIATKQRLDAGRYALSAAFLLFTPTGGKRQTCALRTRREQIAAETLPTSGGERVALTVAGAATIPAGGGDVRLVCEVAGGRAQVTNVSITSIRAAEATVTNG